MNRSCFRLTVQYTSSVNTSALESSLSSASSRPRVTVHVPRARRSVTRHFTAREQTQNEHHEASKNRIDDVRDALDGHERYRRRDAWYDGFERAGDCCNKQRPTTPTLILKRASIASLARSRCVENGAFHFWTKNASGYYTAVNDYFVKSFRARIRRRRRRQDGRRTDRACRRRSHDRGLRRTPNPMKHSTPSLLRTANTI